MSKWVCNSDELCKLRNVWEPRPDAQKLERECGFAGPCLHKVREDEPKSARVVPPPDPGEGYELVPERVTEPTEDMEFLFKSTMQNTSEWAPRSGSRLGHQYCWYRRPLVPAWAKLTAEVCRHVFPLVHVTEYTKARPFVDVDGARFFREPRRPDGDFTLIGLAVSAEYWRRKDAGEK